MPLRAERAALLGYDRHAAYVTADETAGSPEAVHDLLRQLWPCPQRATRAASRRRCRRSWTPKPAPFALEAHDWAFYTEKVRAGGVRPRHGGAAPVVRSRARAAGRRVPRGDRAVRRDVHRARRPAGATTPMRACSRCTTRTARPLGLFVLDLYTRDTKRGGAWMNSIVLAVAPARHAADRRQQSERAQARGRAADAAHARRGDDALPRVRARAARAVRDRSTYPHFAGRTCSATSSSFRARSTRCGSSGPRCSPPTRSTSRPVSRCRRRRARSCTRSETFNQGFATSEYLAAAWLDQAWHSLTADEAAADIDVAAFEASALADIGLDNPAVPTRYSSTYFAHVFSGGYSAGYYSYIWSEVLDADTVEWFHENGGLTRANGDRFRARLLGVGGSRTRWRRTATSAVATPRSSRSSNAEGSRPETRRRQLRMPVLRAAATAAPRDRTSSFV